MTEDKITKAAEKDSGGKLVFQQRGVDLPATVTITTDTIKKYICPKASDAELWMFVNIARSQGLNPLLREIHFVPYRTKEGELKHSIVTGYEVYLKRVLASGLCEGFKVEMRNVGTADEEAVYIGYRKGWKEPFEWAVKTAIYHKHQSIWNINPIHMIKKIAVSQGMRWQFADAISGIPYTPEEVQVYGSDTAMEIEASATVTDSPSPNAESVFQDLKPAESVAEQQVAKGAPQKPDVESPIAEKPSGAPDPLREELKAAGVPLDDKGETPVEADGELDDMELYINQVLVEGPTTAAMNDIVNRVHYPIKEDPARIFAHGGMLTAKTKIERLGMYYRECRKPKGGKQA